jgi:hypothetical protein
VSAVATRLRPRLRPRAEEYVLCPVDGSWFRPLYTDGMCPLCGEPVAEETRGLPWLMRADGFWIGMAALGIVSLGMTALVLYTYFAY